MERTYPGNTVKGSAVREVDLTDETGEDVDMAIEILDSSEENERKEADILGLPKFDTRVLKKLHPDFVTDLKQAKRQALWVKESLRRVRNRMSEVERIRRELSEISESINLLSNHTYASGTQS